MADIAVNFPAPNGTAVDAFLARTLVVMEGQPVGAPVATATVAGCAVTLSGLVPGERYVVVATSPPRRVTFGVGLGVSVHD